MGARAKTSPLNTSEARTMANLLKEAISADGGERAAKSIQDALGIESDAVANYCFPKPWPAREQRARIIGRVRRAFWPDLISSAM
jgi:hypothetical protein